MRVLEVGGDVFLLRFLPDNRRLLVGTADGERKATFHMLSLPDGGRVPLDVPREALNWWWHQAWYGNVIAVPPGGELCYVAWAEQLHAFRTADGKPLPVPRGVRAQQVVLSPDGG